MKLLTRNGLTRASAVCRCGDPRAAHEHYRSGTECTEAGCTCARFATMRPWAHVAAVPSRPRATGPQPRLSPDLVGATSRTILD